MLPEHHRRPGARRSRRDRPGRRGSGSNLRRRCPAGWSHLLGVQLAGPELAAAAAASARPRPCRPHDRPPHGRNRHTRARSRALTFTRSRAFKHVRAPGGARARTHDGLPTTSVRPTLRCLPYVRGRQALRRSIRRRRRRRRRRRLRRALFPGRRA